MWYRKGLAIRQKLADANLAVTGNQRLRHAGATSVNRWGWEDVLRIIILRTPCGVAKNRGQFAQPQACEGHEKYQCWQRERNRIAKPP